MSTTRRWALVAAGLTVAWLIDNALLSSLDGPCNPDDLTGCGGFGEILLVGWYVLLVLVACIAGLVLANVIARGGRRDRDR